ncbi:MAG: cation:proton antiporter [Alphaproteobacteria bacterium]|nr:cation:proton antiporter [Alphaproteobacteria bacterium]
MPAHTELTALAIVILAALVCGMIMTRLRQPAIVGYILAGVLLGQPFFGDVTNREHVSFLAELGVLMLLFFIGMELSLRGFRAVWKTALGAALLQIGLSLALLLGFAYVLDWPLPVAVVFAFVIALSSTAVVVKMLEQMNILRSQVGQLTLGVLIAQDLAVVPMLLAISALGTGGFGFAAAGKIALSIVALALLIWYLSRRHRITLPFSHVVVGHVDLTPLSGLAYCFGAAALSGLIGLSPAFGAFLAGLVIGNSTGRPAMVRSTRPIQSVLLMIFFLSIGLLIDLRFIWDNIWTVLAMLLAVTVLKTALNIGILHLLREPWPHAFIAGVLLAQIGEFSFVLGSAGVAAGVISDGQNSLIVAVAAFSLLFSPIWQITVRRLLRILLLSVTSFPETFRAAAGRQGQRVLIAGGWAWIILQKAVRRGRRAGATAAAAAGDQSGAVRALAAPTPDPESAPAEAETKTTETPAIEDSATAEVIELPGPDDRKRRAAEGA